jgi:hypothetical protein
MENHFVLCKARTESLHKMNILFLCALAKLRKVTIRSFMSVRLSVRLHGTTRLPLDGFSLHVTFEYFSKIFREIPSPLKYDRNSG